MWKGGGGAAVVSSLLRIATKQLPFHEAPKHQQNQDPDLLFFHIFYKRNSTAYAKHLAKYLCQLQSTINFAQRKDM